jgi:hypothetical protein
MRPSARERPGRPRRSDGAPGAGPRRGAGKDTLVTRRLSGWLLAGCASVAFATGCGGGGTAGSPAAQVVTVTAATGATTASGGTAAGVGDVRTKLTTTTDETSTMSTPTKTPAPSTTNRGASAGTSSANPGGSAVQRQSATAPTTALRPPKNVKAPPPQLARLVKACLRRLHVSGKLGVIRASTLKACMKRRWLTEKTVR